MKFSLITLLALVSILNLTSCGQKGPLYLPPPPPPPDQQKPVT
ncbi:LPS translocon maturation chaperone LptM [Legionella sp. D16C41]